MHDYDRRTRGPWSLSKFVKSLRDDARETGEKMTQVEEMGLEVLEDLHGRESHPYEKWLDLHNQVQDARR